MDFLNEINHFYYQMSLQELRKMKGNDAFQSLSHNSLLYLDIIAQKPDCTVSELAQLLHITKSAVTIKTGEMVKKGFLVKRQSETDRRVYYFQLSEPISRLYEEYDNIFTNIYKTVEQTYRPEEIELFCRMLRAISACDWEGDENEQQFSN